MAHGVPTNPNPNLRGKNINQTGLNSIHTSIIGLVVEFVVAIDEARVRFTDDAETTNLNVLSFFYFGK
jgi:hypothetical protein